jgi:RNA polymerase sigma-70 factor (ECF subfamily)
MTDEELYAAVKAGDLRAFDELYARHEVPLFSFLLSSLKSRADAEDVFQEAFMSTLRSREVRFDRGATFRTWLFRVARNAMLNRIRSEQRRDRALEAAPGTDSPTAPDDRVHQQRMLQALDAAIQRLPPPLAEVYQLRTTGFSYEEMAHVLDLPLGTLKSRMNRMVSVLREDLHPWIAP